jgi:hypothetical protein
LAAFVLRGSSVRITSSCFILTESSA